MPLKTARLVEFLLTASLLGELNQLAEVLLSRIYNPSEYKNSEAFGTDLKVDSSKLF
jgi:hypothetical protein